MNSECDRIADQLRRAFTGDPWHGDPLQKLLSGVTDKEARTRALPPTHTIFELVLHIEIYLRIALEATRGVPMPKLFGTEKDWPAAPDSPDAWSAATMGMFNTAEQLAVAIEALNDSRLTETGPGRDYDFYYLFHGVVQHSLYHGGQIAMLRKATALSHPPPRADVGR